MVMSNLLNGYVAFTGEHLPDKKKKKIVGASRPPRDLPSRHKSEFYLNSDGLPGETV